MLPPLAADQFSAGSGGNIQVVKQTEVVQVFRMNTLSKYILLNQIKCFNAWAESFQYFHHPSSYCWSNTQSTHKLLFNHTVGKLLCFTKHMDLKLRQCLACVVPVD